MNLTRSAFLNNEARITTKTVVFDGTAGKGATGDTDIFEVTGDVVATFVPICTESLVSGGAATLKLGINGNGNVFIADTTYSNILAGREWIDTSPSTGENMSGTKIIPQGLNIQYSVSGANVTDGTLIFYILWRPLSSDGNVAAL